MSANRDRYKRYAKILRELETEKTGKKHEELVEEANVLLQNMINSSDRRIPKLGKGEK